MSIWMFVHEGSMVNLDEFMYLYYLKPWSIMGILNFIFGIGILGSSMAFLLPFTTWSLGTSSSIGRDGKLFQMKFGVRCLHCCICGRFPHLVHFPFFWFSLSFENLLILTLFILQQKLIQTWRDNIRKRFKLLWIFILALRILTSLWILGHYTTTIWNLNLQPTPKGYSLRRRGVRSCLYNLTSSFSSLHHFLMNDSFCFVGIATHFSQDRYACAKEKKNQPLLKISSPPSKKQKVAGSGGVVISSLVHTPLLSSPAMSIEELPSPPRT